MEDFVPNTTDSEDKDREASCHERAVQQSDPNATTVYLQRCYIYKHQRRRRETQHPYLNPKNTNHRRYSTTKGDVIVCWFSEHMFTVKEL